MKKFGFDGKDKGTSISRGSVPADGWLNESNF